MYHNLAVWRSGEANRYRASYAYTSLSEVIGAYWRTLEALGYSGTVTETAQGGSSYLFTGAQGQLGAIFTLLDDTVTVTLTQLEPNTGTPLTLRTQTMNTVFFNALSFQSKLANAFRDMILARELGSQRSTNMPEASAAPAAGAS